MRKTKLNNTELLLTINIIKYALFVLDFPQCDQDTEFTCQEDKGCLPVSKRCDGKVDCYDQTDEDNCGKVAPHYNADLIT